MLLLHEVNYLTKPIFEMHEVPEALAKMGHEISFVHFPEGKTIREILSQNRVEKIQGRVEKDANLNLFTPRTLGGSIIGRLLHSLTFYFQFAKILEEVKPDIVYSYSVPTSGWQALIACKKRNIPYLFRALDASTVIRKTIFSRLVKVAEKYIYRNADWVSANNLAMLEHVTQIGASVERSSVEYPPVDLEHFDSKDETRHRLRSELGLAPESRVILFMGSFFYFSGLPNVIRSFAQLREKEDYFVLIGMGEQDKELRAIVKSSNLEEFVIFTGRIEFEDLPGYLSLADVAINAFVPSMVSNTALPNKVIQYMAAGLPVVSTKLEGLVSAFGEKNKGLVFVDKPEMVIPAALRLLSEGQNLQDLGISNKKVVESIFGKEAAVQKIQSNIQKVKDLLN